MAKQNKLSPIGAKILVSPEEKEEKTASGIFIPQTASQEKPQKGKIIALGTGKVTSEGKVLSFNVKVGQTVLFKKYSPDSLEIDGKEYLIMEEEDILAVINE